MRSTMVCMVPSGLSSTTVRSPTPGVVESEIDLDVGHDTRHRHRDHDRVGWSRRYAGRTRRNWHVDRTGGGRVALVLTVGADDTIESTSGSDGAGSAVAPTSGSGGLVSPWADEVVSPTIDMANMARAAMNTRIEKSSQDLTDRSVANQAYHTSSPRAVS